VEPLARAESSPLERGKRFGADPRRRGRQIIGSNLEMVFFYLFVEPSEDLERRNGEDRNGLPQADADKLDPTNECSKRQVP